MRLRLNGETEIWVYGAGKVGLKCAKALLENDCKLFGLIDQSVQGPDVFPPLMCYKLRELSLKTDRKNAAVIICLADGMLHSEVAAALSLKGFHYILYLPMECPLSQKKKRIITETYNSFLHGCWTEKEGFMNTRWDRDSLVGAEIEYRVRLGGERKTIRWRKGNGWGFTPQKGKPGRNVFYFSIGRTLPKDATAGYVKIGMNANEEAGRAFELKKESLEAYSYIMGRDYINARFTGTDVDNEKAIGLVKTNEFGEISQFHQGSGEDSLLDMFRTFDSIPKQSLLVIDEVENSLHPRAQRRLVQYLLDLARRQKIQVILSTHSSYVLDELPPVARIMLLRLSDQKDILYGISSQFALSSIDEESHPELYVYLEDTESEMLFWEILKNAGDQYASLMKRISTQAAGSSSVINTLEKLAKEKRLPQASMAVIDGDKKEDYPNCVALPGDLAPERMVFEDFKRINWDHLDDRFGIGAGTLYQILDDVILLPDHHDWTTYVGDKTKKGKQTVWSIMVEEWCRQCMDHEAADAFINKVLDRLEENEHTTRRD